MEEMKVIFRDKCNERYVSAPYMVWRHLHDQMHKPLKYTFYVDKLMLEFPEPIPHSWR